MPRTRQDIDRAIRQVTRDGPVPLAELAVVAGVTAQTLERWVRHGRDGVYLQAIRRGSEWLSSPQAVGRFVAELARVEEQEGEDLAGLMGGTVPRAVAGAARVTRRPSSRPPASPSPP